MYTIKRGGAYDRFIMLIEAFLERGCEVHCLSLTPIQIRHPFFHNHVAYWPFSKMNTWQARLFVVSIFPLWALWSGWRNKIDLIVAFGILYAFIQGFSKYLLRKPMVTLIRGDSSFGLRMRNTYPGLLYLNCRIESLGLRFSDSIITNSGGLREEISKKLKTRRHIDVKVLPNNIPTIPVPDPQDLIPTRARYGIPEDAKVLITAGVLNRGKNIETLISCLAKIEMENLHLLITGDGSTKDDFPYREFLEGLTRDLKVENRVHFPGWVEKEELSRIYAASDLFILPSMNEGMPNAMLEALGSDLPCLGSNIPGIRDILYYEELMFDPTDEQAIVNKINQVFSDVKFFNRIRELCRERKQAFTFDWKQKIFQTITEGISSPEAN
ncbi:MAG: glycosyltransferase family 4 protein [Syntrophaceae bacterium]|nr:glycosyltransferase family 4 protein [Syntrophaceae bacterium]